jgi:hypothetical protein
MKSPHKTKSASCSIFFTIFGEKEICFSLSDLHPPLMMRTDEEMDLMHYSKPKNGRFVGRFWI